MCTQSDESRRDLFSQLQLVRLPSYRLQDTAARLPTRCRYSIKTLASGVGAERDAGCTRADDAAGGGVKKKRE